MVHEARNETEKNKSETHQEVEEALAQLVTPTRYKRKYITAVLQIFLKGMCETPFLVSTQVAGLIEVITHGNNAKNHA